ELIPEFQKSRSDHFTLELTEAPVNTSLPAASGASGVGSVLSCSPGAWSGVPAPAFTYGWQRDGKDIEGEAASTYTTKAADDGSSVRCEVPATNSAGSASAFSNAIAISAAAPSCAGGDIVGAGSTLQLLAQEGVWIPGFQGPGGQCFGKGTEPQVGYEPIGS